MIMFVAEHGKQKFACGKFQLISNFKFRIANEVPSKIGNEDLPVFVVAGKNFNSCS